jgi:hypothetical protein
MHVVGGTAFPEQTINEISLENAGVWQWNLLELVVPLTCHSWALHHSKAQKCQQ